MLLPLMRSAGCCAIGPRRSRSPRSPASWWAKSASNRSSGAAAIVTEGVAVIRLARPARLLSAFGPPLLVAAIGFFVVVHSVDTAARSLSVEFLTYGRVLGALRHHLELV